MEQDFLLAQTLKQEMDTVSAEQVKLHEEVQREKANIQKVNIFYAVCCCQTSANRDRSRLDIRNVRNVIFFTLQIWFEFFREEFTFWRISLIILIGYSNHLNT